MVGNGLLVQAVAAAHLASATAVAGSACSWCRQIEDTTCDCPEGCGRRDCPAALAVDGVSPFNSSPVPVPKFR
ncbi:MAG TPA: hypothetical protein VHV82_02190 [Sporichthyaceae bacterium]|nr:hypothetical protein [Sporichthyaceae bacterium]